MAFDLDDEELKATRELNGVDKKIPTPDNPIPIEKQTQIIELERRDVQSEIRYWNKKYIDTFLELVKEKEENKKLKEVIYMMAEDWAVEQYGDNPDYDWCKEREKQIKEYYFKKARGEK